jgi:putative restriction endonuclease
MIVYDSDQSGVMRTEDAGAAFLERIQALNVWRQGGQRAPHKPLLLLYALARVSRAEDRLVSYEEASAPLRRLLAEFAPAREILHPEYPFWRLERDGVWEVDWPPPLQVAEPRTQDPSHGVMVKHGVKGGFPKELQQALTDDPTLIQRATEILLRQHFPDTVHQELLTEVGLDLTLAGEWTLRVPRDPTFRQRVLLAYEFRCTVCGLDLKIDHAPVGLDAAHIRWKQVNGPDTESNGLALCTLHHRLFDRGAFTVDPNRNLLVSRHAIGEALEPWLMRFHGQPIRQPQEEAMNPAEVHLEWHGREVFRAPARGKRG